MLVIQQVIQNILNKAIGTCIRRNVFKEIQDLFFKIP